MRKLFLMAGCFALGLVFASGSFASSAKGDGTIFSSEAMTVKIDPDAYGVQTFQCNSKIYYSDIILPNVHGCEQEPVLYGGKGDKALLVTVHYDWHVRKDGSKEPKIQTFMQMPDETFFRIGDTRFLNSGRLHVFFDDVVGWSDLSLGKTNITLDRFSQRRIDNFANTFCVQYYLRHPFRGTMGWCQNDRIVGGDAGYLKGAMSFTRAALLVQDYVNHNRVGVKNPHRVLSRETMTALNSDVNGWLYYAFSIPAKPTNTYVSYYVFRVYFNGKIEMREIAHLPDSPDLL